MKAMSTLRLELLAFKMFLLAVLGCAVNSYSQDLELGRAGMNTNLKRWDYHEGLPSVGITDIAITPDGYLWLATVGGPVRFNGHEFYVFNTDNVPALRNDDVRRLLAARDGTLWLSCFGGDVIAYRDRTFTAIEDARLAPPAQVNSFHQDSLGRILRNPLQLIMGFSELIGSNADNPEFVRKKSRIVEETSERMTQLIHDLLQTSSVEAGKMVLNRTRVDLTRTARDVLKT